MDASPTRELSSNIRPRVAFLPRRLPSACPLRPLPAPAGLRQSRKGNSREGNAEGNFVQSIFLKETRGKETSACPGGGQQVAENGGNERAVPIQRLFSVATPLQTVIPQELLHCEFGKTDQFHCCSSHFIHRISLQKR